MSIYQAHFHNIFMTPQPAPCFKQYLCRYISTVIPLERHHSVIRTPVHLYTFHLWQNFFILRTYLFTISNHHINRYLYMSMYIPLHTYIYIYIYIIHILIPLHTFTKLITIYLAH